VQHKGSSLQYASEDMKSNEKFVMAAVQQKASSLQYASEDMKSNEKVVMAAVQQDAGSLQYASEAMKTRVKASMMEFECDRKLAVRSLAESTVVQLSARQVSDNGHGERGIAVTCTNLGGNVVCRPCL